MNSRQKEILQSQLDSEQAILKKLKGIYKKALDDVNNNIAALMGRTDTENLQSVIYQLQYQKALKTQINGVLDTLNGEQFNTIADYLSKSYEDGFAGVMYDLHGQGIPLIFPIDQDQVVRAIQHDTKLSKSLYDSLGEDVSLLKKRIQNNISRGIAQGSSYADIARNVASGMVGDYTKMRGGALGKAYTIARTEGHRITNEAAYDAQKKAKEKGADSVKKWSAALDKRTRPHHARLDGQIREIDEPFEIDGRKAMYPGGFGVAAEDINCRCRVVSIPKWALDEDELQTLKDRAEYFGLDKTDSFEDFKKKYLKAVEETDRLEKFAPAKTIDEAQKYAKDNLGLQQTTAYSLGLNVDVANGVNEAIYRINSTFNGLIENGYLENVLLSTNKTGAYAMYSSSLSSVFLNPVAKQKSAIKKMAKDAAEEFVMGSWSTNSPFHSIYHELGHAVQHMKLDKDAILKNKIDVLYSKTFSDIMGSELWSISNKDAITKGCAGAKDAGFSYYGLRNSGEFVAESVAQYFLSDNPSDIAKKVVEILKGG